MIKSHLYASTRSCLQGFLVQGLQRTAAGLGSVIIDSQPLTVALLASLLFGERLGPAGYAGLAVGVLGLCLLEVPPSMLESLPQALAAGGEAALAAGALRGWRLAAGGWVLI
jgi:drug/metabolite transporter (DMT)-like permease